MHVDNMFNKNKRTHITKLVHEHNPTSNWNKGWPSKRCTNPYPWRQNNPMWLTPCLCCRWWINHEQNPQKGNRFKKVQYMSCKPSASIWKWSTYLHVKCQLQPTRVWNFITCKITRNKKVIICDSNVHQMPWQFPVLEKGTSQKLKN